MHKSGSTRLVGKSDVWGEPFDFDGSGEWVIWFRHGFFLAVVMCMDFLGAKVCLKDLI